MPIGVGDEEDNFRYFFCSVLFRKGGEVECFSEAFVTNNGKYPSKKTLMECFGVSTGCEAVTILSIQELTQKDYIDFIFG